MQFYTVWFYLVVLYALFEEFCSHVVLGTLDVNVCQQQPALFKVICILKLKKNSIKQNTSHSRRTCEENALLYQVTRYISGNCFSLKYLSHKQSRTHYLSDCSTVTVIMTTYHTLKRLFVHGLAVHFIRPSHNTFLEVTVVREQFQQVPPCLDKYGEPLVYVLFCTGHGLDVHFSIQPLYYTVSDVIVLR